MKDYKYIAIANQLLNDVHYRKSGRRLPSERKICGIFKVSRITAKKALNHLKENSKVTRHVGRGTFISTSKSRISITLLVTPHLPGVEMISFFKDEISRYAGQTPGVDISIKEIQGNVVSSSYSIPGVKIIYWPYAGYVSPMDILVPLDEFSDFTQVMSLVNNNYCHWGNDRTGRTRCYSIPMHLGVDAFMFNREYAGLLGLDADRGPSDWNDILHWCKATGENRKRKIAPTFLSDFDGFLLPSSYYYTLSGGNNFIFDDKGKINFSFDSGVKWLKFFRDLHLLKKNMILTSHQPDPIFSGKTLFTLTGGTWMYSQKKRLGSDVPVKVVPIPPCEKNNGSVSRVGKYELAIASGGSSSEDEIRGAWDFIKYLTCEEDVQERLVGIFSSLAANKNVFSRQGQDMKWAPFIQALATGIIPTPHPVMFAINAIMKKYFRMSVFGGMDPEEATVKIDELCRLQIEIEKERSGIA
ncbi:MAG: hypothetical protein A2X48_23405 [Lentisphaerae bacterium GWF2_49_21]|nr:MAG: hypothetical protein A2X48_23405 [Lentisphaerae bacterium GWF2_49_21]